MKVIITENKLERIAHRWLDQNYGDLKSQPKPHMRNTVSFYNDKGKIIFEADGAYLMLVNQNYDIIMGFIEGMFGFRTIDAKMNISSWFKKRYGHKLNIPQLPPYFVVTSMTLEPDHI